MTATILLIAVFLVSPTLIIYLCKKIPILDKLGAGILCYGLGMLIGNIGVLPASANSVQMNFMTVTIPVALSLMLFSLDVRRWRFLAGKALLSCFLMILAALIATFIGYMIYRDTIEDAWKVAGMLVGIPVGTSANLNAIGLALKAPEHLLVLTNTADMIMCTPYFILMLTFAQRLLNLVLRPFCPPAQDGASALCVEDQVKDFDDYSGIFKPATLKSLAVASLISGVIFCIAGLAYTLAPKDFNMAALIISITTLGIIASFVPYIHNLKMTFQFGQYIMFVFCLVVGSLSNLEAIVSAMPSVIIFTGIVVYGCLVLHIIFAFIFRIDADTVIITNVAGIFSAPFVPVIASVLKNKDVILSGIITGIIGLALGNYLGIAFAYFLKNLSFLGMKP
ncbi:MAG: DUF819 family protein [Spirochaetes bacterium]|nr:MAG: DUF819 family protein [Spirochaetota bacterium]